MGVGSFCGLFPLKMTSQAQQSQAPVEMKKSDDMDLEFLAQLATEAGRAILEVYSTDFGVERKGDDSPLTLADMRSHRIITEGLRSRYPHIPILSEEGREVPHSARQNWNRFWCVDPLDGTKEFVKKNGEFTINIALIQDRTPVLGLIHVPVAGDSFMAQIHEGAWKIQEGRRQELNLAGASFPERVRILKSRSHPSPHLESLLELIPHHETLQRGSALKFCSIASGEADFYPRLGPTWEWDTAAGQAIVSASGGVMTDFKGRPFIYNKPSLINGPFLVAASGRWLSESGILQRAASLPL